MPSKFAALENVGAEMYVNLALGTTRETIRISAKESHKLNGSVTN
jgi:hypothetical protein